MNSEYLRSQQVNKNSAVTIWNVRTEKKLRISPNGCGKINLEFSKKKERKKNGELYLIIAQKKKKSLKDCKKNRKFRQRSSKTA